MTRPFTIDLSWGPLLGHLGVQAGDILRAAGLPEGLFSQDRPSLSPERFARFSEALYAAVGGDAPGLALARAVSPEVFSPPLFAAYCSADLWTAAQRLGRYKPLIGPLYLGVEMTDRGLELTFAAEPGVRLPREYAAAELVFLVSLARRATGVEIVPRSVMLTSPPEAPDYAAFFGVPVESGSVNRLVFSRADAMRPFLSANPALFEAFEPGLRARLDDLTAGASLKERLDATLMEAIPSGTADVGHVAAKLGISPRTLQRRLGAEKTSFQLALREMRERLAREYLSRTEYSSAEIAFLLGYEDPNSFIRAFHDWTGSTPEAMRGAGRRPS